ncbi:MAG: hypothetical protein PUI16_00445 [Clostridia bacterium]|nr:hypothetical protein [Clostridia bacterium]MDY5554732.1 hypothetical protein [Blautia sp.]
MMMDYITLAGFILAVFGTGVAVGRILEKIERLVRKKEDKEHKNTSKNDRYADIGIKEGIIKGPLLQRNIFADESNQPVVLLIKILNNRK